MGEFLQQRYAAFVSSKRRYVSQVEFADYLDVEPYNLNQWMNANRKPVGNNVHHLAAKLGPIVYDILEVPRQMPNDPQFQQVAQRWFDLSDEIRDLIMKVMQGDPLSETEWQTLHNYLEAEPTAG
jgi:hypothetical protein